MNWRQMKKFVNKLSESQLKRPVIVVGDEKGFRISHPFIEREDMLCPPHEPDLAEPRSLYESHPEQNEGRPMILSEKGDPILFIKE